MRSTRISDRVLYALLGAGLGMLFTCCLGGAGLALQGGSSGITLAQPPAEYDIEAIVEETYINRTILDSLTRMPLPVPVLTGHLDVRPGAVGDFKAQMELGPLRPVFEGTVTLRATEAGRIDIEIVEARAGYFPVTAFIPPGLDAETDRVVNEIFEERAGGAGVRLVGIASDETTLRFYLVSEP